MKNATVYILFPVMLIAAIQFGIWHGRNLERAEIDEDAMYQMAIIRGRLETCQVERAVYFEAANPDIDELREKLAIVTEIKKGDHAGPVKPVQTGVGG